MIRSICVALLAILTFVPVIQADDNAEQRERLSKFYQLEKPDGTGPFPAVILVSGCSGFFGKYRKNHYNNVQSQLLKSGFVSLRVNYLEARYAQDCREASTLEVADDICIAAEYLIKQDFVKKGAVNVIGWSWGGASAFQALRTTKSRKRAQVDAVVAYYPYCREGRPRDSEIPILVLAGGRDKTAPFKKCKSIFSPLPEKLTVNVYENAYHGFDNSEFPEKMHEAFGTVGYNEVAAKAAWLEVTNFLKR